MTQFDPLERYSKLVDVQIKILKAVDDHNRSVVETDILWAKKQTLDIQNVALGRIAQQMEIARRSLQKRQRELEDEQQAVKDEAKKLKILATGYRPASAPTLFQTFQALNQFLAEVGGQAQSD